jgi:hypothetical protein
MSKTSNDESSSIVSCSDSESPTHDQTAQVVQKPATANVGSAVACLKHSQNEEQPRRCSHCELYLPDMIEHMQNILQVGSGNASDPDQDICAPPITNTSDLAALSDALDICCVGNWDTIR